MKPRRSENIEMLAIVAKGLEELKEKVVFVGGATIDLYLSDPALPGARTTDDVDCVVELGSRMQYYDLEEELRKLGFKHPLGKKGPVCRWDYRGVVVDVMPTQGQVLGFKNRWYAEGVAAAEQAELPDGQRVWIFPPAYLIASKLEAFLDRGRGDHIGSPDMEDVLAVLDGGVDVEESILAAPSSVRDYLKAEFGKLLAKDTFVEAVHGHVPSAEGGASRAERVLAILKRVARGS